MPGVRKEGMGKMTKYIAVIAVVALLFCLTGKAYCFSMNDLKNAATQAATAAAQQAASAAANKASKSTSGNNNARASAVNLASIDLDKGVFGVPLKSGVQDVAKWCLENNVTINNLTKQQAEQQAQQLVSRIKRLKADYNNGKWLMSEAEKQVAELTTDQTMDAAEKMAVEQARKSLDILKNPTVDYQGNTYFLQRLFGDGLQVSIGGVDKVCTDSRITQTMYVLTVVPSEKSEKLLNNSVQSIQIYFKRDASGNVVSYATLADILNDNTDVFNKQYSTMTSILNEKYGAPAYFGKIFYKQEDVNPNGNTLGFVLYHLLGNYFDGQDALLWRKNIMLLTEFGGDEVNRPDCRYPLYLIYYDFSARGEILEFYKQVIKNFEEKSSKEDENKVKQMKQDF